MLCCRFLYLGPTFPGEIQLAALKEVAARLWHEAPVSASREPGPALSLWIIHEVSN